MRLGIAVPTYLQHGHREGIVRVALKAEELGYDSIWVPDHVVAGDEFLARMGPTWFDPFVTLSYLSALTHRIKLGLAVLVVPYRHPIFTAKLVSTLDQLSGGRVILGVGSGHLPVEFRALGLPIEKRGPMTDEFLTVLKQLWQGGPQEFHGRYCDFPAVTLDPSPIQQPHPPIWVGGNSRASMRRAAQHGDGWHPLRLSPSALRKGVAAMRDLEQSYERSSPVTISLQSEFVRFTDRPLGDDRLTLNGTPDQVAEDMRAYADAGLDHIALRFGMARDTDELVSGMERFAEVIRPALAG